MGGVLIAVLSVGSMIISGLSLVNDTEKNGQPPIFSNTAAIIIAGIGIYLMYTRVKKR